MRNLLEKNGGPGTMLLARIPAEAEDITPDVSRQPHALVNTAALMFAQAASAMASSAAGHQPVEVVLQVLTGVLMFAANVLGQLWDDAAWVRPFSVFYYYQPQKVMLKADWTADPFGVAGVPVVAVLVAAGAAGYLAALAIFTRRDLPAPLGACSRGA